MRRETQVRLGELGEISAARSLDRSNKQRPISRGRSKLDPLALQPHTTTSNVRPLYGRKGGSQPFGLLDVSIERVD